jgi:hypothetical protein
MPSTEAMQVTPTTAAEVSGSGLGLLRRADTLPTRRHNPLGADARSSTQPPRHSPTPSTYNHARSVSDLLARSVPEKASHPHQPPLPSRMSRKRPADDSVDWDEADSPRDHEPARPNDHITVLPPKSDICICRPDNKIPRPRNGQYGSSCSVC